MKYIHVNENKAHEVIEEFDPKFPNVPISERYSASFLNSCVEVDDEDVPPIGYLFENGVFVEPPAPIVVEKTAEEKKVAIEQQIIELQNKLKELEG